MTFFVLSGFVIAHTLHSKTADPKYSLRRYLIERFSRVYSAYAPALLLIAGLDFIAAALGAPIDLSVNTVSIFLKNLVMLEGYPSDIGVPTFGTAGQLTSLAVEFHIYLLVGGAFFFCIGRNRITALLLAIAASSMPFAYFTEIPASDRNLFVLWLIGFAGFYMVRAMRVDGATVAFAALAAPALLFVWFNQRTPGLDYALAGYPLFALAFLAMVVASQGSTIVARRLAVRSVIHWAATYSYSLFLIHFTIQKLIIYFWPGPKIIGFALAVIVANAAAHLFANATERKHRSMAA